MAEAKCGRKVYILMDIKLIVSSLFTAKCFMARCGFSSMKLYFLVDRHVAQATLQLSEAELPSMLRGFGG